jgi:hypothetical protein
MIATGMWIDHGWVNWGLDIADGHKFSLHVFQPELYASKAGSYYRLRIGNLSVTLGFVLPVVAEVFRNQSG